MPHSRHSEVATTNRQYAVALSRAFAGATIFSLPLLMTMEMWWLGFYRPSWTIIQFSLVHLAMLYGLSKIAGFEESHSWTDDVLDAFAAYAVAVITAAAILWLIGAFRPGMTSAEIAGMIAIQAVPASFGAMIGAKLMGDGERIEKQEHWRRTYGGQLFLMLAGALFLCFTVAPTEEVLLISLQMTPVHGLVMIGLSVLILHSMLYLVGFRGQASRVERRGRLGILRLSLPGYAIAVTASAYILWTFGRVQGLDLPHAALAVVVLAFPASIGAAISRIVV